MLYNTFTFIFLISAYPAFSKSNMPAMSAHSSPELKRRNPMSSLTNGSHTPIAFSHPMNSTTDVATIPETGSPMSGSSHSCCSSQGGPMKKRSHAMKLKPLKKKNVKNRPMKGNVKYRKTRAKAMS